MPKWLKLMLVFNTVFFLLFVFGSYFQFDLFSQKGSYANAHLTKSSWDILTVTIQDFNYGNGVATPSSGFTTYPNIPSILFLLYWFISLQTLVILGRKEGKETASQNSPS